VTLPVNPKPAWITGDMLKGIDMDDAARIFADGLKAGTIVYHPGRNGENGHYVIFGPGEVER
jgi:hypothetical protein